MVKFVGSIIGLLLMVSPVIWGQQKQKNRNPFSSLLPLPSSKILTPKSEILPPKKLPSVLIPNIKPSQNLAEIIQKPQPKKTLKTKTVRQLKRKNPLKKIAKRKSEQISKKKVIPTSNPKLSSEKKVIEKSKSTALSQKKMVPSQQSKSPSEQKKNSEKIGTEKQNISKETQAVAIRKSLKNPRASARGKQETGLILTGIVKTSKGRFAMIQIGEFEYVVSEREMIVGKQLLEIQEGHIILQEEEKQKILMIQK